MKKLVRNTTEETTKIVRGLKKRVNLLEQDIEYRLKREVTPAIIGSFGFIIALVWRDAIKEALNYYLERTGLMSHFVLYTFISAILVTVMVIMIMMGVSKYSHSRRFERIKTKVDA